jgi:DNA-directed RNA polymerase subunit RPC12/RpoP
MLEEDIPKGDHMTISDIEVVCPLCGKTYPVLEWRIIPYNDRVRCQYCGVEVNWKALEVVE